MCASKRRTASLWVAGSGCLAALRSIEHYPYAKVLGKILEAVLDARSGENQVTRGKGTSRCPIKKNSTTAGNDVNLVAGVRRLLISASRRVVLDEQRPMTKKRNGSQG